VNCGIKVNGYIDLQNEKNVVGVFQIYGGPSKIRAWVPAGNAAN